MKDNFVVGHFPTSPNTSTLSPHYPNTTAYVPDETEPSEWIIFYTIYMICILVVGVIGNLLVISAVFMSDQLRKRATTTFVVGLAICDIYLATTQIPFNISIIIYGKFTLSPASCYFQLITDVSGNISSIFTLFLLAIDRYIAVTKPFRYGTIINSKRSKILVVAVWVFAFSWSIAGLLNWKDGQRIGLIQGTCINQNVLFYMISYAAFYIPALIVMTFTYLKILFVAIHHIRAIESGTPYVSRTEEIKKRRKSKFTRELKATKSIGLVYLAFFICWFPLFVINGILLHNPAHFPKMRAENPVLLKILFYFFGNMLYITNTAMNPFIYSFSNKQFRDAFKHTWYKMTMNRKAYLEDRRRTLDSIDSTNTLSNDINMHNNKKRNWTRSKNGEAKNVQ